MPQRRLAVALVWHMHQPWYRDDVAGEFVLPWVRRRASKDYLPMLRILDRHPRIRVTMNMVPSLLQQLRLYADPQVRDAERDLCLSDAATLSAGERRFLLDRARRDDYGRRVQLLAPYMRLLARLPEDAADAEVEAIRDLQAWTLLAWVDPELVAEDAVLAALAGRGGGFSDADKRVIDSHQLALVGQVIPAYARAVSSGQVEAMTSPFHHPILPLLIDSAAARVAVPDAALPEPAFARRGDALEHVTRGLAAFNELVGAEAAGMWPPECAVSPAAAALVAGCAVRFAVSDEAVLARSLGSDDVRRSGALYRPHRDGSGLTLLFRDAELSNRVGFVYQAMEADAAAADLVGRLEEIAARTATQQEPSLATIALDGENFRDFYAENGTPFLDALYRRIVASPLLRSVRIGDFLDESPDAVSPLPALWTGSWINADLGTWIGDAAHGRAWTLLRDAAAAVDAAGGEERHPGAHEEVLVAEASDWFWWFGDDHNSGTDAAWDALFRTHIRNAYALAGLAVPAGVDEPIVRARSLPADCAPLRAIEPRSVDDREWLCAGVATVGGSHGAMRPPASSVERVLYGAGNGAVHLRFAAEGGSPSHVEVASVCVSQQAPVVVRACGSAAIPAAAGSADVVVTLEESGRRAERVPLSGALRVVVGGSPRPRRVVLVAAECAPVAVVGELAQRVAGAAGAAVVAGCDVVVVIPRHRNASPGSGAGVRLERVATASGVVARVLQGALPGWGVPVLSVDAPALFDRPGIYGEEDDGERYLAFCALTEALLDATGLAPDVVHGFEWQTAPLLDSLRQRREGPATVNASGADARALAVLYRSL